MTDARSETPKTSDRIPPLNWESGGPHICGLDLNRPRTRMDQHNGTQHSVKIYRKLIPALRLSLSNTTLDAQSVALEKPPTFP